MLQFRSVASLNLPLWPSIRLKTLTGVAVHQVSFPLLSTAPLTSTRLSASTRHLSTALHSTADSTTTAAPSLIPITLLGGFLGSGKTTTLKHILTNNEGYKVGVVVNDVADVNIDAKLISDTRGGLEAGVSTSTVPTVQLENGCACCSLSDELATSIQELLDVGEKEGGNSFDRIVIELSGVADPTAVIGNFESLILSNHPLRDKVDLRNPNVVTLVDAGAFGKDWMTWNTAGEREGWVEDGDACSESLLITELLAEQVEAADTLVVNKIDMVSGKEMKDCEEMVRGLNSKARVFTSEFGKAPVIELLRSKGEEGEVGGGCQDKSCGDPKCETHGDVVKEDAGGCNDPGCGDPNCKTHGEGAGHDHGHSHDHEEVESKDKPQMAGITSFTYKASRPFHMDKLLGVLNTWPVPVKDTLDLDLMATYRDQKAKMPDGKEVSNPFVSILRSKGFCWLAPQEWNGANGDAWRHDTAMYWSHASKHFGINQAGKWWGTLESKDKVREFLKGREKEAERIFREDWVGEEFGDRRQELVFIGVNYDEEDITKALDDCLFTEDEMDVYRAGVATVMDV